MSDKIKPCPFCGGTNIKPREGLEWSDVTCMDCRQSVISFPCASEGIWNTRPIEDAFQARIAELEMILAADKLIEDGWIGRIEAGDKRIAELEKYRIEGVSLKTIEAVNESFRKKVAQLEAALDNAGHELYGCSGSCPSDLYDWEHPNTCIRECDRYDNPDEAWKCWRLWLLDKPKEDE